MYAKGLAIHMEIPMKYCPQMKAYAFCEQFASMCLVVFEFLQFETFQYSICVEFAGCEGLVKHEK